MNSVRPIHRAYIAGVFDGEGCVTFRKDSHPAGRPRISIGQKDPEVLLWIQSTLGYGRVRSYHAVTPVGRERRVYWRFDVSSGEHCEVFIDTVLKYSIIKRKKLRKAKRWLEGRR